MLVRRLLALVVAVGLVLGAAQLRNRLFEPGTAAAPAPDAADLRIVCAAELEAACEGLPELESSAVIVEEVAVTIERLTQPEPDLDVWITVQPMPALAADARARSGAPQLAATTGPVAGRTPVVLAARADRLAVLEPACDADGVSWTCIGDRAGTPWSDAGGQSSWGRVKVGIDHPDTTARGLLTLAQATSDFAGGQWNSRTLQSTDYFAWLSSLGRAVEQPVAQTPLEVMLLTGGAEYEFAGALEADARSLLERAAGRADQIELRQLAPRVTAEAVVAGYGDAGSAAVDGITADLAAPLADAGWEIDQTPAANGTPQSESSSANGLPSAAALEALRQVWIEVARE